MIVDVRTYTLVPRKMATYLELFEKHALPVMQRHGLELMGYYVSQSARSIRSCTSGATPALPTWRRSAPRATPTRPGASTWRSRRAWS